jgi:hypothetical protein
MSHLDSFIFLNKFKKKNKKKEEIGEETEIEKKELDRERAKKEKRDQWGLGELQA